MLYWKVFSSGFSYGLFQDCGIPIHAVLKSHCQSWKMRRFGFWLEFFIPSFSVESIAFWVLTILITFVCQAYLLARYGQTIGKRMLKIKIVNEHSYQKPTLTRSFFLERVRNLLNTMASNIAIA